MGPVTCMAGTGGRAPCGCPVDRRRARGPRGRAAIRVRLWTGIARRAERPAAYPDGWTRIAVPATGERPELDGGRDLAWLLLAPLLLQLPAFLVLYALLP